MKNILFILSFVLFSMSVIGQEIPTLETYTLKNGLKVYLMQYGKIDAINVKLMVNTGEKNEVPGQQGYAEITAEMLLRGNTKYTQQQQSDMAFKLGGDLSAASGKDYTTINANCLSKNFDVMMDLFSAAIISPKFDKEKLDMMISGLIDYNMPSKMDISDLADVFSDYFIYGTSNPLGRNYYKAQLQLVTPEKIKEFHAFNFTPKNSSVIVCGKFDAATVKAVVEKYFSGWQSTYGEVNGVALDFPQIKKKEMAFINRSRATQCALHWTKTAPSVKDKDLIAFSVANRIFNVVLFSEIREKGGKTYSIGSSHETSRFSNLFQVGCSVRSEEMLNTINLFDKTLQNFNQANITQEEFERAVRAIKIDIMSSEMPTNISSFYNPVVYDFNKRKNYLADLDAVKLEDVQKAIKKYYTADAYKLVIAGDESVVTTQLNAINGLIKFKSSDIEKDN